MRPGGARAGAEGRPALILMEVSLPGSDGLCFLGPLLSYPRPWGCLESTWAGGSAGGEISASAMRRNEAKADREAR